MQLPCYCSLHCNRAVTHFHNAAKQCWPQELMEVECCNIWNTGWPRFQASSKVQSLLSTSCCQWKGSIFCRCTTHRAPQMLPQSGPLNSPCGLHCDMKSVEAGSEELCEVHRCKTLTFTWYSPHLMDMQHATLRRLSSRRKTQLRGSAN